MTQPMVSNSPTDTPAITEEGRAAIVSLGKKMETTITKLMKNDPQYAAIIDNIYNLLNELFED